MYMSLFHSETFLRHLMPHQCHDLHESRKHLPFYKLKKKNHLLLAEDFDTHFNQFYTNTLKSFFSLAKEYCAHKKLYYLLSNRCPSLKDSKADV